MKLFAPSDLSTLFNRASAPQFHQHIAQLMHDSVFHRTNLTLFSDYTQMECWLAHDKSSGFAITPEHELVNVFSRIAGNGTQAIAHATRRRDYLHLNCYARPLEQLYAHHGFEEIRREKNWSPGGQDVVFMQYQKGIAL